jgi:MoaA/NifB/PqqE/SkfB family radical SAM enzyme
MLIEMRRRLPGELEGVCSECFFKSTCLGSCVAQNYYSARNLTEDFWFCHQAYEAGVFPVTRLLKSPEFRVKAG